MFDSSSLRIASSANQRSHASEVAGHLRLSSVQCLGVGYQSFGPAAQNLLIVNHGKGPRF